MGHRTGITGTENVDNSAGNAVYRTGSKLQDAYMEAKEKAEQEAAETTEPGAHGVYDLKNY